MKKSKSKASTTPKIEDEAAQERKILGSASSPARKTKKKKKVLETEIVDDEDFGAASKKFVVDQDDLPKKKKKKVLAKHPAAAPEKIIKKNKAPDSLKRKADKKREALESEMEGLDEKAEEFADSTWVKTYHVMFRKLRRLMRVTEKRTLKSDKAADVYALMALYNQMREVIADLRSMIDLSQNTQRIIDQVLYPLTRDISNSYVDSIFKTMKVLRANVEGEKYSELKSELDRVLNEHGKYIQAAYEKSSQKLSDLLED